MENQATPTVRRYVCDHAFMLNGKYFGEQKVYTKVLEANAQASKSTIDITQRIDEYFVRTHQELIDDALESENVESNVESWMMDAFNEVYNMIIRIFVEFRF